ncbi:MAG: glycerol-3-phosphate dehydrogenase/oxidase [Bacteroidota bacterium]
MNRDTMIDQLVSHRRHWDICIIGGGATGLGTAIDAASRGYRTILFEKVDFAKGTSSRSTKLVHGGVRYLQQGNIKLVMDALKERGTLKKNAPHLVKNLSFIVPNYKWWEGPYYGLGLKVYDWMSGNLGLGPSEWLSKEEVLERAPTLDPTDLRGGVLYHDGQFDDARLAVNMAQTAVEQGACLINYCGVKGFIKTNNKITGLQVKDQLSGKEYEVNSKTIINATGVFSDAVQQMDNPKKEKTIAPSQGIHIVLDADFLPGNSAIMIPHTDDGRVLFAVPWHKKVIVGTTDTPVKKINEEPQAQAEEINFIIHHIGRYLTKYPSIPDIKSIFAGLRPLVKAASKKTAELSRDHVITVAPSGLINILGGKWTTYRKMAEDVVNVAAISNGLPPRDCVTETLHVHGAEQNVDFSSNDYYYGSDLTAVKALAEQDPSLNEKIHEHLPYTKATIVWAVQQEMCMTVDDALARRTRALLLDARAAVAAAPVVATLMAKLMNKEAKWIDEQVASFKKIALHYIPLSNQ